MRLCYFIMCHQKPEQFARLLAALDDPRDIFLTHVSASTPEAERRRFDEIVAGRPNARILPPRRVVWGHWSLPEAHRAGLAAALEHPGWDYLVHLSGQCFPIKSRTEIRERLAAGAPPDPAGGAWPNYVSLQPVESCPPGVLRRRSAFWVLLAGRMLPLPIWRRPPEGVDFGWKGDYWSALHRDFCDWLVNDRLPAEILRFLRRSKHASEFWLHWSIMSGPFRETRRPCLHFSRWPHRSPRPAILTRGDFDEIRASDRLFARKFDLDVDAEIVAMLERNLGAVPAAAAAPEARRGASGSGARPVALGARKPATP